MKTAVRLVVICGMLFISALIPSGVGKAATASLSLGILTDAANGLGAAADAIAKLGDSVAHLVGLGDHSWQTVSARRTRSSLKDLSARLTKLTYVDNGALVTSIDEYLAKKTHTQADWKVVADKIDDVLSEVRELLTTLQSERSDFVLQPAYATLMQNIGKRDLQLNRLLSISAPSSPEELDELQLANQNYRLLVENTKTTIAEMNKYIAATGGA